MHIAHTPNSGREPLPAGPITMPDILLDGIPVIDLLEIPPSTKEVAL